MKKINFKDNKTLLEIAGGVLILIIGIVLLTNSKDGGINLLGEKVNIKKTEAQKIKLVEYDHVNFTMKIPEGWQVSTSGSDMYFAINVYNPKDDRYQIYSILKAEPFLKNDKAKAWYENYYNLFGGQGNMLLAKAVVLSNGTVEDFYSNWNSYLNYIKIIEPSNSFKAPDLKNFAVVETYNNNSQLTSIAKDDKILRGTFQDSETSKNGEGLFMATIVNPASDTTLGYDVIPYTAYNVMGITAAENELINYEKILTECVNSIVYKDSFVNTTRNNINQATENTLKINKSINDAFNSYNAAWTNRQKTYDITSQKYSDATLGYERIYDTETGDIYKAYNGFTDDYTGNRYKTITDDMYSESITGYIEK